MSLIFKCCEKDKTKKCEVDINITKKIKDNNNIPYNISTKDTQINRPSVGNNLPLVTASNFSKAHNITNVDNIKKNENNEHNEGKSDSFIKNLQRTIKIEDSINITPKINSKQKLRATNTVAYKRDDEKKNNISISDLSFISERNEEKENFSKLLLTGDLFFNKEIIINECGMINSKRNKKDGYTAFGLNNSVDIYGKLNNDFIINFKRDKDEIGNVDTDSGKVFEIKFNKERKEYTHYFVNPFLYIYYKITNYVYFYPGKDYYLFVGKIFFSIAIEKKGNEQIINIQVDNTCKDISNPEKINQQYSFSSENKPLIKIGRIDCDINICEKCISKIHGIIEFSKINQKYYYKDMKSTNGTTLLIKKGDFLKIKGEMYFKLEDVTFKIQEIP